MRQRASPWSVIRIRAPTIKNWITHGVGSLPYRAPALSKNTLEYDYFNSRLIGPEMCFCDLEFVFIFALSIADPSTRDELIGDTVTKPATRYICGRYFACGHNFGVSNPTGRCSCLMLPSLAQPYRTTARSRSSTSKKRHHEPWRARPFSRCCREWHWRQAR